MKNTSKKLLKLLFAPLLFLSVTYNHAMQPTFVNAHFSSVDEAVESITNKLIANDFSIPLVVNHSAAAASVGLELRPTTVIFARQPKALEFLSLRRSETIGIDLPIKFLVFEDALGDIQVRGNGAGYLIDRHDAKIFDFIWRSTQSINSQIADTEQGLVTILSENSLPDTVEALRDALSANPNFRIPLSLNFCERSWRNCPQLIVFGNPNVGTPLMQASQEIGIDLPQKFLVWQNASGQVFITYNDPFFIAARHNIVDQEARLQAISNALANFASQGASLK